MGMGGVNAQLVFVFLLLVVAVELVHSAAHQLELTLQPDDFCGQQVDLL